MTRTRTWNAGPLALALASLSLLGAIALQFTPPRLHVAAVVPGVAILGVCWIAIDRMRRDRRDAASALNASGRVDLLHLALIMALLGSIVAQTAGVDAWWWYASHAILAIATAALSVARVRILRRNADVASPDRGSSGA